MVTEAARPQAYPDKPREVRFAELAIWTTIVTNVLVALLDRWSGAVTGGSFLVTILFYGLVALLPHYIGRRSQTARVIYALFSAMTCLLWLGGLGAAMTSLSRGVAYLTIPLSLLAVYSLFRPASNRWFAIRWITIDRRQAPGHASSPAQP
jgi:bacteriorhodopsin